MSAATGPHASLTEARDFAGMAAIVTGGASGIGAPTAALLLRRGARVAVLDRDPAGAPPGTVPVTADVTDDAVRAAVAAAVDALGGALDTLVGNAGIGAVGTVEDNADEEWRHVLDVNGRDRSEAFSACTRPVHELPTDWKGEVASAKLPYGRGS